MKKNKWCQGIKGRIRVGVLYRTVKEGSQSDKVTDVLNI